VIVKSLRDVAASALHLGRPAAGDLSPHDAERLHEEMQACIESRSGEVATRARATAIGERYTALAPAGRRRFFDLLAGFDVDHAAVAAAAAELAAATEPPARDAAERALRKTLIPARIALLRAFNSLPNGVKFLVDLRADLLGAAGEDPHLRALDADLKELLASWFDVGFLEMRRITWDAPASLLEKLARYEAVHEIRGWADLKNRLDVDRRCFAFLHPAMPDEPLIFVEVALVDSLAGEMHALLDPNAPVGDPSHATHAIFYSISNCQRGLDGISFGNVLIKRVVHELAHEFRGLRVFATLSPIPRFHAWLEQQQASGDATIPSPLRSIFSRRAWFREEAVADSLKVPVMQLAAHYLVEARRPNGKALDPVAHFHLSNGARMERIAWLADTSPKGLRESAGMMVNYVYQLDRIDDNQAAYASDGRIDASPPIVALLGRPPTLLGRRLTR
jgi:malonyl-CoA decarboxylase